MHAGRGCEPSEIDVQPRPETIFDVPLTQLVEENIPEAKEYETPPREQKKIETAIIEKLETPKQSEEDKQPQYSFARQSLIQQKHEALSKLKQVRQKVPEHPQPIEDENPVEETKEEPESAPRIEIAKTPNSDLYSEFESRKITEEEEKRVESEKEKVSETNETKEQPMI